MALRNLMTEKQIQVLKSYLNDDWKYMILSGAVRSGKTYIDNYIFLLELRKVRQRALQDGTENPKYILAGYSNGTIYNNVISELENTFGIEINYDRRGHFHLFGVEIVPAYTGSSRGIGGIRGMTSYGAYVNEASLATEGVFQEIVQRCSKSGARIICDTNPDSPQHWLKTDYIDNEDPEARIKSFHFTLDDNTFLADDYVKALKAATPTGMFYDRSILGLWVTADGIVYRDFDQRKMVIHSSQVPRIVKYYCGVDWGFEHKGVITVWGDDADGNIYLIEEHTSQYKYIDYWVRVANKIRNKYGKGITFWVDSARPDNYSEFLRAGINARNADKARMAGVERVAEYMKQGKFFAVKEGMDQFLNEVYQYVWDENTGEPKKENDDVLDSCRYAIFNEHKDNQTQFLSSKYF